MLVRYLEAVKKTMIFKEKIDKKKRRDPSEDEKARGRQSEPDEESKNAGEKWGTYENAGNSSK